MLSRIAIFLVAMVAGRAWAEAGPSGANLAVDFQAEAGADGFAAALEELVGREVQRFQQVRLSEKIDAWSCLGRQARCMVERYRKAGADVVVLGRLEGGRLAYRVYQTWAAARAFDGSLEVAGVSTVTLQRHVGEILRPIVQRGGLLDQRPSAKPQPASAGRVDVRTVVLVLVGLLVLLAWPGLMLLSLVGFTQVKRRRWPSSWKWSALLMVAIVIVWVATRGDPGLIAALRLPGERLLPVVGGMLWGAFAWVHVRWAFAPIHGLGQVRHDALRPLLWSWLALSLMRATLLLLYAPVAILTLHGSVALALSPQATYALALPAAGLLACFWLLTLIDNLAFFIDVYLVTGPATDRNPWHDTMRRYFVGYLRRNGIEVGSHLIDGTLFLPSEIAEVVCYGGGFSRPRILVGSAPRLMAFGELPDEREAPERQVNPEELQAGVLVPGRPEAARAKLAAEQRRALTHAPPRKSVPKPRLIGEPLTLLGWVLPQPTDTGIPLIASTQEEYEIVKGLLQEHYGAFERNIDDDEVDDTDPTQKDFLFGALIREMGAISRGDCVLATLRHCLAFALPKASLPVRVVMRAFQLGYTRLLAGPATVVGDAHAALHRSLHHLIQYIDLLRGGTPGLTTRASAPQLVAVSKLIFDRLALESPDARLRLRPTPTHRLLWLSRFFHAPLGRRRGRRLWGALALFAAGSALAYGAVSASVAYHPIYVDRMQKLREAGDVHQAR